MVKVEYITKKVPKEADEVIKYIQAHYQLETGQRATESEVIRLIAEHYAEEKYGYKKKAKYSWKDIEGSIKGGKKSTEKDIDRVVYGI